MFKLSSETFRSLGCFSIRGVKAWMHNLKPIDDLTKDGFLKKARTSA